VQRSGVKVGIVGAAGTHTSGSTKAIHVNDLTFIELPTGHWPQFTRPRELGESILTAIG
jgi:hypothetical protein